MAESKLLKLIHIWWFRIFIFILMSFCVSYIRSELLCINYNGFYAVSNIKHPFYQYIVVVGGYFFYFRVTTVKKKFIISLGIAFFIFLEHFILRFLFY